MNLNLQITLEKPPANLAYALQKGSGSQYQTEQMQFSDGENLIFNFTVEIKGNENSHTQPDFKGAYVQGPVNARFIYLDIGTYATNEERWGGRLKIPLTGITWADVTEANKHAGVALLQTKVPGTGKNGKPNCATVKPFSGWRVTALQ